MVCESRYSGWFNTINLAYDPTPLLEANNEEFKTLIKKKNRYVISNQHPILLPGKLAKNYESVYLSASNPCFFYGFFYYRKGFFISYCFNNACNDCPGYFREN